ncbi:hypothetical protein [Burkholderia vietnamiensis]|uniref:hypothetical protein n=1 Tax=Burkholderia vietnamiensis TaxID=60552 RepID=UPI001CF4FC9F|nr:hypothetical protein [Burkholderia vietnamiensis]MCA8285396.1 hypothetical protein [Burkholderia vietnamiensis]
MKRKNERLDLLISKDQKEAMKQIKLKHCVNWSAVIREDIEKRIKKFKENKND